MPVTIGPPDSATISTTEYFLAGDSTTPSYQTTDGVLQALIDTSAMQAGDQFEIKMYEKIDGTNARLLVPPVILEGAQSCAFVSPAFIVGSGWEVSIKRLGGSDRTFAWSLNLVTAA